MAANILRADQILRALLLITILAMAFLAFLYLRQRRLALLDFCAWGLLALVLPLLGPFLVFVFRPGMFRPEPERPLPDGSGRSSSPTPRKMACSPAQEQDFNPRSTQSKPKGEL
jgi:hypothetical protein